MGRPVGGVLGVVALCVLVAGTVSCSDGAFRFGTAAGEGVLFERAKAKQASGDTEAALRLYRQVLRSSPGAGAAHLELSLLLHDHVQDYVGAIYHYRQYLELTPGSEKKAMIEARIAAASLAFARTVLPNGASEEKTTPPPDETPPKTAVASKKPRPPAQPPAIAKHTRRLPARTRSTTPPPPATYVVQRGDTLGTIARKVYDDPAKWRAIYMANREVLSGPSRLMVGQTLKIPR